MLLCWPLLHVGTLFAKVGARDVAAVVALAGAAVAADLDADMFAFIPPPAPPRPPAAVCQNCSG